MFPCDEGETCIKKGGATCMGYCEADDFRMCGKQSYCHMNRTSFDAIICSSLAVNLNELVCEETLGMYIIMHVLH